jgi:hypothetical protein
MHPGEHQQKRRVPEMQSHGQRVSSPGSEALLAKIEAASVA